MIDTTFDQLEAEALKQGVPLYVILDSMVIEEIEKEVKVK
jgi:hypothetical protein